MITTVMAALLWSGAMALDTAEKQLELGFPVEDGATLRIENLLGSVSVRMLRDKGPVQVEARVVAEGKSEQEASDLVATVQLLQSSADGVETIHVGYPLDTVTAFRPPKDGLKGLVSRWSSALMRRGSSAVEYEGRSVDISKDRKAAGLAVHLTVRIPADLSTSIRQGVGSVDVRFIRGDIDIQTDAGSVDVVSCFGDLNLSAGEADVRVASLQGGSLTADSGGGILELDGIRSRTVTLRSDGGAITGSKLDVDDLKVENGAGNVAFVDLVPVSMDVRTGSGDVDLAFRIRKARNASIHTDTGDVVLRMNERLSFGLTAETKKGEVTLLGMNLELLEQNGLTSRYKAGSGGVDVAVTAPGGQLTVRPYDAKRIDLMSRR
jgi:DUF4097 and DUF4098 domain-containing protein YvlB